MTPLSRPLVTVRAALSKILVNIIHHRLRSNIRFPARTHIWRRQGVLRPHGIGLSAFHVYKVQAPPPCIFMTSQSSISVPASGGSFSFALNTTSGCQWSTVSQSPWISIESNSVSGSNTGSIAFDVQALSGNVPRSGTVQVGNASNTVTVTVNQSSGCGYSLSVGPQLAFPYTGGSATVQVSTQTGCAWSASSNGSWLTLLNGSGTGSGHLL
jgi:Viral BACON domain